LPADVVGTMIYNIKQNEFSIKRTNFCQFRFADEINRAPAKVQSALAMQEKQVTIGDTTLNWTDLS
jgi:MoxR-like ATPase